MAKSGPRHLPEFTIVEWYRRGVDYQAFIREAATSSGRSPEHCGRALPPPDAAPYQEAVHGTRRTSIRWTRRLRGRSARCASARIAGAASAELARGPGRRPQRLAGPADGQRRRTRAEGHGLAVVDRYPAEQAALARLDPADPRVAERFEIYLDGIELANGYHELADAGEQRRRFECRSATADHGAARRHDRTTRAARGAGRGPARLLRGRAGFRPAADGLPRPGKTIDAAVSFAVPEAD